VGVGPYEAWGWQQPPATRPLSLIKMISLNFDGLVKSQKTSFFVITAKAGIQCFQKLMTDLDPGFRRGDDFLRVHQFLAKQL